MKIGEIKYKYHLYDKATSIKQIEHNRHAVEGRQPSALKNNVVPCKLDTDFRRYDGRAKSIFIIIAWMVPLLFSSTAFARQSGLAEALFWHAFWMFLPIIIVVVLIIYAIYRSFRK